MSCNSSSSSQRRRSGPYRPTFFLLTFHGQKQILVNTNGSGGVVRNALSVVDEALGPFMSVREEFKVGLFLAQRVKS
jgi:hypothetical protein